MKIAFLAIDAREPSKSYDRQPYFGNAPAALLDGFVELGEPEVHIISCLQHAAPAPEKLADNLFYHQLVVPKSGWMGSLYSGCVKAVQAKLAEIGPDLIHAQGTERESAICAARAARHYPKLLTIHGNMRAIAKIYGAKFLSFYWLAARLERYAIPRMTGIVCVSTHTQRLVAKHARATYVIPNAADASFFAIGRRPAQHPTILCIGSIDRNKNQVFLIDALAPLAAERPFKLSICGRVTGVNDPSYGVEFERRLAGHGWCEHQGFASREQLREALALATAIILPSHEDNCPMVILEAMAAGVPVIASRVGGIPDLIEDGVTGLFCDPDDPGSIAGAVRRLLDDPELARRISARAREQASAQYRPAQVARRHLELYRSLI